MSEPVSFRSIKMESGWLMIKPEPQDMGKAMALVRKHKNKLYDLEVKEHRTKRSLDANAYYWHLCGEIARLENVPPVEIYRHHIRDIANYEVICMQTKAVEAFDRYWTNGHLVRFTETRDSKLPECTTVLAYYGSSDFDRSEMSRLIDNCIQDCKALGIETMTPDKIALLNEEWDA